VVARMSPQTRRLMHDAIHVESVQTNFFGHLEGSLKIL
jgi:hypothetical protein